MTSNFETTYGARMNRDCGFNEPAPGGGGTSFWLFCDSAVHDWTGSLTGFIPGSTAALGSTTPGQVPTDLNELPTPPQGVPEMPHNNGPAMFLPQPTGLVKSDGQPCAADDDPDTPDPYPASWPSGVTRIPGTSRLLITAIDLCVESSFGYVISRFGTVEYTPSSNTFSNKTTLFTESSPAAGIPEQIQLGSPVFMDGSLYLFSRRCDGTYLGACTGGNVWLSRVPSSQRGNPGAYEFSTTSEPDGWTDDVAAATSILPDAHPIGVSVDTYTNVGRNLVMVEEATIGGDYNVWEASDPAGPWTKLPDQDPDADDLRASPGCTPPPGSQEFCRTLIGHPELSTTDEIAVTYWGVEDGRPMMATTSW